MNKISVLAVNATQLLSIYDLDVLQCNHTAPHPAITTTEFNGLQNAFRRASKFFACGTVHPQVKQTAPKLLTQNKLFTQNKPVLSKLLDPPKQLEQILFGDSKKEGTAFSRKHTKAVVKQTDLVTKKKSHLPPSTLVAVTRKVSQTQLKKTEAITREASLSETDSKPRISVAYRDAVGKFLWMQLWESVEAVQERAAIPTASQSKSDGSSAADKEYVRRVGEAAYRMIYKENPPEMPVKELPPFPYVESIAKPKDQIFLESAMKSLLASMLEPNPDARPSPKKCLEHVFFVLAQPKLFFLQEEEVAGAQQVMDAAYIEGTHWSRSKCPMKLPGGLYAVRRYQLDKDTDPKALWRSICRTTWSFAAYGFVGNDSTLGPCLYAIYEMNKEIRPDWTMLLPFSSNLIASYDVLKWVNGGMSTVLKARDAFGKTVAVKIFRQGALDYQRESQALYDLGNLEGVPQLYTRHPNENCLALEWVEGSDLKHCSQFRENHGMCRELLRKLLRLAQEMRASNYAHRDIKPGNLMRQEDTGKIKLIDFGLATNCHKRYAGTPEYMAPEALKYALGKTELEYDPFAADVYSIALTWYELFFGVPFPRITKRAVDGKKCLLDNIKHIEMPGRKPELDDAMRDLFLGMVKRNPKKRLTIEEALAHRFFT